MAVATHEKPVKCPKCGKAFVFFMKQVETVWDASAISEEQRRAIEWECARLINHYANLNDEGRWEEVAALYGRNGQVSVDPVVRADRIRSRTFGTRVTESRE